MQDISGPDVILMICKALCFDGQCLLGGLIRSLVHPIDYIWMFLKLRLKYKLNVIKQTDDSCYLKQIRRRCNISYEM